MKRSLEERHTQTHGNLQESVCKTIHHLLEHMGNAFKDFVLVKPWPTNEDKVFESAPHMFK